MTSTKTWTAVAEYLRGFEAYYPSISEWCLKVRDEVPSGRRSIFAFVSTDGFISGLAVTKNAERAKLCHISVSDELRTDGLGASLMRAAVFEMLTLGARRIHVTTGEEVALSYGEFFERFGFNRHSVCTGRYRRGIDELEWVALSEVIMSRLAGAGRGGHLDNTRQAHTLVRLAWEPVLGDFRWTAIPEGSYEACCAMAG